MSYFSPEDFEIEGPARDAEIVVGSDRRIIIQEEQLSGLGAWSGWYPGWPEKIQKAKDPLDATIQQIQSILDQAQQVASQVSDPNAFLAVKRVTQDLQRLQAQSDSAQQGLDTGNQSGDEIMAVLSAATTSAQRVLSRAQQAFNAVNVASQKQAAAAAQQQQVEQARQEAQRQATATAEAQRQAQIQYQQQMEQARIEKDYAERAAARQAVQKAEEVAQQRELDRQQRAEAAAAAQEAAKLQARQADLQLQLQLAQQAREGKVQEQQLAMEAEDRRRAAAEAAEQRKYEIEAQRLQFEMDRQQRLDEQAAQQAERQAQLAERQAFIQALSTLPSGAFEKYYGTGEGGVPTMDMALSPGGRGGTVPLESLASGYMAGLGADLPPARTVGAADQMVLALAKQAQTLRATGQVAKAKVLEAQILELQRRQAQLAAQQQGGGGGGTDWGTLAKWGLGIGAVVLVGPKLVKTITGRRR